MRAVVLLALLALAACASAPQPPKEPPAPAPPLAPAPALPADPCAALEKPLLTLRQLASVVAWGRSMSVRPLRPELFVAELDADAERARRVSATVAGSAHDRSAVGDADLAKLAADTSARLTKIASGARALLGAKRDAESEAARISLLEEMERGELLVALGDERCVKGESMAGHLPASALKRVVRAADGGFKSCHEAALRRDPSLRGTIRVHFVVARDGTVREAADADRGAPDPLAWGSGANTAPLRDAAVSACVVAAFRKLTFPRPEGGTFSATLPIELGPAP